VGEFWWAGNFYMANTLEVPTKHLVAYGITKKKR